MGTQWVDSSAATHLPVCECGWRGALALDRGAAWRAAVEHARTAHHDARRAAKALQAYERRNHG